MAVRTIAAPPTPWSKNLAEPRIDESAYVHSFSNIIGDVLVGPNVLVAPGTSIRADEGTPFHIGESTNIQDGVVIHGLEKGRVVGDDSQEYSVWIGKQTCITHMALIHGPAYVGDECFIGFRSTVFNARVGRGCIIMMHALIQDVEIPPGKYIPSGAIITNQQQADRLPNVNESDRAFAYHVVEINKALRVGYQCASDSACITPLRETLKDNTQGIKEINYKKSVETMTVNPDLRSQIRYLLSQGHTISAEHADQRRFKTKSWLSCGQASSNREDQVLREIESWLQDYQGEYVRLIAVDPHGKKRVQETIIQRPTDSPAQSSHLTPAKSNYTRSHQGIKPASTGHSDIAGELVEQIRSILNQGYKISTEFANERRFRTKSWITGPAIETHKETVALQEIESVLADHKGEYVRLIAVDPTGKRRIMETIIQRPNGDSSIHSNGNGNGKAKLPTSHSRKQTQGKVGNNGLDSEVIAQVRSLLAQGLTIGMEHADQRRFKTKSWYSCSPIDSNNESQVLAALQDCLNEHQGEYVRLLGIDRKAKRRVVETIIQRPGSQTQNGTKAVAQETSYSPYSSSSSSQNSTAKISNNKLNSDVVSQVRSILSQGLTIGTEHADKRRFKTKSWQSCSPMETNRESDILTALEACLAEHEGEYVRLLGIDANAKRRVIETIIQRP